MAQANAESVDVRERVRAILEDAEAHLDSRASDPAGERDEELEAIAGRAAELLSESDPGELLAAVGSGDVSSDQRPESLPEAMAQSDPDTVVKLRKLLTLSKLDGEADDEAVDDYVERFRELSNLDGAGSPDEADDAGEADVSNEAAGEDGDEEGGQDAADEDFTRSSAGSDAEESAESADESDYSERLRGKLQDGIDEFRDGIQRTRSELTSEDEPETDATDGDSARKKRGQGTMFSTMPSRDRADMQGPARLSTVRNNRTDDRD